MKYLLDTHALLWWVHEPQKLSKIALEAIRNPDNDIAVSAVSAMEIATKHRKGRLEYRSPLAGDFLEQITLEGFTPLAVTCAHAQHAGAYPAALADPWDRLLAAQAELEGFELLSCDEKIVTLGATTVW